MNCTTVLLLYHCVAVVVVIVYQRLLILNYYVYNTYGNIINEKWWKKIAMTDRYK